MSDRELPSPAYLRQRLRHEVASGRLYWRPYAPHGPRWNGRWAGREALACRGADGYLHGAIDGDLYLAHRVIWAMVYDAWPPDDLDHEDHDRSNNRLGNLRPASDAVNSQNKSRYRNNTSGVTGVIWQGGRWVARITVEKQRLYLGVFADLDAAVRRRKAAEFAYGFHPNHGAA